MTSDSLFMDMSCRFWYHLQKPIPFDLIWPLRESLFPPLALIVMVEVCTAAKWTHNVFSCCFSTFAYWQLIWEFQIFPQYNWRAEWRVYVP